MKKIASAAAGLREFTEVHQLHHQVKPDRGDDGEQDTDFVISRKFAQPFASGLRLREGKKVRQQQHQARSRASSISTESRSGMMQRGARQPTPRRPASEKPCRGRIGAIAPAASESLAFAHACRKDGRISARHMNALLSLTQRPPRSTKARLGNYALLPRMLDKCRAELAGKNGSFHYACPNDQRILDFLGIGSEALKAEVAKGGGDGSVLEWIKANQKIVQLPRKSRPGAMRRINANRMRATRRCLTRACQSSRRCIRGNEARAQTPSRDFTCEGV